MKALEGVDIHDYDKTWAKWGFSLVYAFVRLLRTCRAESEREIEHKAIKMAKCRVMLMIYPLLQTN